MLIKLVCDVREDHKDAWSFLENKVHALHLEEPCLFFPFVPQVSGIALLTHLLSLELIELLRILLLDRFVPQQDLTKVILLAF